MTQKIKKDNSVFYISLAIAMGLEAMTAAAASPATALLLSGGLGALQTASIAAAFPFIFVMIFAMISLVKALREEDI